MKITVHYYAVLRDVTGTHHETVEVEDGGNGYSLISRLTELHPGIEPYVSVVRLATDEAYIQSSTELKTGSTVYLIPPVSGG